MSSTPILPGRFGQYSFRKQAGVGLVYSGPTSGSLAGIETVRFSEDAWRVDPVAGRLIAPTSLPSGGSSGEAAAEARGYARGVQAAFDAVGKLR